jgi:hypothetical protein
MTIRKREDTVTWARKQLWLHFVENWLWKRLLTCRKIGYVRNEWCECMNEWKNRVNEWAKWRTNDYSWANSLNKIWIHNKGGVQQNHEKPWQIRSTSIRLLRNAVLLCKGAFTALMWLAEMDWVCILSIVLKKERSAVVAKSCKKSSWLLH